MSEKSWLFDHYKVVQVRAYGMDDWREVGIESIYQEFKERLMKELVAQAGPDERWTSGYPLVPATPGEG